MANPITWQNVNQPDFRGSLDGLLIAGQSFDRAGTGLSEALGRFDTTRKEDAAAALIQNTLDFGTPEELAAARASGVLFNGVNRSLVTPAAVAALDGRATNLLNQAVTTQNLTHRRAIDPLIVTNQGNVNRRQDQEFEQANVMNPLEAEGRRVSIAGGRISNALGGLNLENGQDAQRTRREGEVDARSGRSTAVSLDDAPDAATAFALLDRNTSLSDGAREAAQARLIARWGVTPQAVRALPGYTDALTGLAAAPPGPAPARGPVDIGGTPGDPTSIIRAGARARAALDPNSPTYATDIARINDTVVARSAGNIGGARPGPNADVPNWDAGLAAPRGGSVPVPLPTTPPAGAAPAIAAAATVPSTGSAPTQAPTPSSVTTPPGSIAAAGDLHTPEQFADAARARAADVAGIIARTTQRQEQDGTPGVASTYGEAITNPSTRDAVIARLRTAGGRFANVPDDEIAKSLDAIVARLPTENYALGAQLLGRFGAQQGPGWWARNTPGPAPSTASITNSSGLTQEIEAIKAHTRRAGTGVINSRQATITNLTSANETASAAATALEQARVRARVVPGADRYVPAMEARFNAASAALARAREQADAPRNRPDDAPTSPGASALRAATSSTPTGTTMREATAALRVVPGESPVERSRRLSGLGIRDSRLIYRPEDLPMAPRE